MELDLDMLRPQERVSLQLRLLYEEAGFRQYRMGRFEEYGLYQENRRFLSLLAGAALSVSPPLGMFRQFVLTRDGQNRSSFNIKKQGVNIVMEMARVYALSSGSEAYDTLDRLEEASARGLLDPALKRELTEAYLFITHVRLEHQKEALEAGETAGNHLEPGRLTQFERNHLRDAFRILSKAQEGMAFRFRGTF